MEQPTKSDDFLELYKQGRSGKNVGIYTPYARLNGYTHGQIPGRYWLIGAESGAGKTTMADEILRHAILSCIAAGKPVKVFYYTFEIPTDEKKARWVSAYLYTHYKVELPSDYILSRIKGMPVTDEDDVLIMRAYQEMQPIFEKIIFIQDPVHPTFVYESLVEEHFSKAMGKVKRDIKKDKDNKDRKGRILSYEPYDPDAQTFIVMDHMALLGHEASLSTKGLIDRMSSYFVTMKNIFKAHILGIQQFSTDLMSTMRDTKRKGDGFIAPQRLDFGDSKYTYRDANVVIGLVQPKLYDIDMYRGYDVNALGDNFIAMYLMKNRDGPQGKWFPMWLHGMCGKFEHMGIDPNDMFTMEQFIEKSRQFKTVCQKFSQQSD
jgi:replicative DNA helicase